MNKTTFDNEKTWDAIAESFDQTRKQPWVEVTDFIKTLDKSYIVADLACGNGRHLIPAAKQCKTAIGVDLSKKLLKITENKTKSYDLSLIHI